MPISHTPSPRRIAVALPVKNEESCVRYALASLDIAARRVEAQVSVAILVNNTTDATCDRVREIAESLSISVDLHDVTLPPPLANAGSARRICMQIAADLAPDGVLMTTDADAVVSPDWFAAALAQLSGADLVCGAIDVRDAPSFSASYCRIERVETLYKAALHDVRFAVDRLNSRQSGRKRPHYIESGASLAMWTRSYDAIGGLPAVTSSEDRALAYQVEAQGLRVRYCDAMRSSVSARLDGRAEEGMAACLKARLLTADPWADQSMLPVPQIVALWDAAQAGRPVLWPDRSVGHAPRLRASDLEAALPELSAFVSDVVRPQAGAGTVDAA